LFFSALLSVVCHAECRRAHDEVPHGANELIELREQTVNRVSGTILVGFGGSEPAGNVVVELYRREGNLSVQKTVQQSRVIACVAGSDGRFSFSGLKSGRYLLRVGMAEQAGINETYAPIILQSKGKKGKNQGIKIVLQLGT